jgi:hypothetical protein
MALYGPRESPELAQTIYDVMFPFLRDTAPLDESEVFINYGVDRFASGVLFKSDMPAAMVEPLLMSHPAEAVLLATPIFSGGSFNNDACADFDCRRGQIAQAIFEGTLSYFNGQTGGAMHIAAIDMSYDQRRSTYFLDTAVSVQDVSDQPVSSAEVVVRITYPDDMMTVNTVVTGDDGVSSFRIRTRLTGTYQAEIVDVSKTNWLYDPEANIDDEEQLTIQ